MPIDLIPSSIFFELVVSFMTMLSVISSSRQFGLSALSERARSISRSRCLSSNCRADRLTVSVNLSARQFEDKHLLREIERALSESALKPNCLELEITESMVMKDTTSSKKILDGIKSMGIRLAIDDFGTGYSSLASIKRFPFDCIKIDRSFIKDIPQDPDDVAITQAIIAMAHSLRLKVIAEGVETQEQLDFLTEHGCHEFQGYFFRKPQPAEDFSKLLRDNNASTAAAAAG